MKKNINNQLSAILNGNHNIEGDRQERMIQIFELKVLEEAVRATDNHRHTSDCDWVITLSIKDEEGTLIEIPSNPDDGEEVTSWGILEAETENEVRVFENLDINAGVDHEKVTHIYYWFTDEDGEQEKRTVLIDDIISIHFELT